MLHELFITQCTNGTSNMNPFTVSNKVVSAKPAMNARWCSNQGRLRILKHINSSTKQTDKQAMMVTEEANITEAIVQVVAEAVKVVVQPMQTTVKGHQMQDPN